jgi:type II secretory ATPase GspE/PulE/Tfp pilus assembly ATPase PilB-like protein
MAFPRDTSDFFAPQLGESLAAALRNHPEAGNDASSDHWTRALVADALAARASDIHLDPEPEQVRVRFRIDGRIRDIVALEESIGRRLQRHLKVEAGLDPADALAPEDARLAVAQDDNSMDIRLSCAPCLAGDKLALRLLSRSPVSLGLAELGLDDADRQAIQHWIDDINGMFLVAGPVGSGKTTTLYSMLSELDLDEGNLVTVEDPVEYQLARVNQMQIDPQRGVSMDQAVRAVLRLDPDFVLLGEMRDADSTRAAVEAAGTGRVVFSTMHSRNASGVLTTLRGYGVPDHEIAASLGFVMAQRLVRRLCPDCRSEGQPGVAEQRWLEAAGHEAPAVAWQAGGCEKCSGIGYRGRIGIFECLPVDAEVYQAIMSGTDELGLRRQLRKRGFRSLVDDGIDKAREGETDFAELRRMGAQGYLERAQ